MFSCTSNLYTHGGECSILGDIRSGVPQGGVFGPLLYLFYTSDIPISDGLMMATFADDTAILSSSMLPDIASKRLQTGLNNIQEWLSTWRIRANESKSVQVTFTTRKETCPTVTLNNIALPQAESAKYLGLHLDRRLTWRKHIDSKNKQLRIKFSKMYWLLGRNSQLTLENKLLLYKAILKPIWTYGIELWGTASISNIEILERYQSKTLRTIVNAPYYVKNSTIRNDLQICSVKKEVNRLSSKYFNRLGCHPNILANDLTDTRDQTRRLKRYKPTDLSTRLWS